MVYVVRSVSNNEMGMDCCILQFIGQIIFGDILCKLHKDVICLVNGTYIMLFVICFLFFFQSHHSVVVNWVIMYSRVDNLAICYFVRITKDVSTKAL
jgi:hypothetical protein